MKRAIVIIGLVLVINMVVGSYTAFCAGKEAAKPALKFPWAGEKLNQPCGKTELEWLCATGGLRQDKPVRLSPAFSAERMIAVPANSGLAVKVYVAPNPSYKGKPGDKKWAGDVMVALAAARMEVQRRFGSGTGNDALYGNGQDLEVRLFAGDKMVGRQWPKGNSSDIWVYWPGKN